MTISAKYITCKQWRSARVNYATSALRQAQRPKVPESKELPTCEEVGEELGVGLPGVAGDKVPKGLRIDAAVGFKDLYHLGLGTIDQADILTGQISEGSDGRADRIAAHRQGVHQYS